MRPNLFYFVPALALSLSSCSNSRSSESTSRRVEQRALGVPHPFGFQGAGFDDYALFHSRSKPRTVTPTLSR